MKTLSVRPESLKLLKEKANQTQDMAQAEAFWVVPKRSPVTSSHSGSNANNWQIRSHHELNELLLHVKGNTD